MSRDAKQRMQVRTICHQEHLHTKNTGAGERLYRVLCDSASALCDQRVSATQGSKNQVAYVLLVHCLHDGVRCYLSRSRADDHDRDLLHERHPLLRVQWSVTESCNSVLHSSQVAENEVTSPVVRKCATLQHERKTERDGSSSDGLQSRVDRQEVGDRASSSAKMLLLDELVLDGLDGERTGVDAERELALDLLEDANLHMLDLDGEHVDLGGQLADLLGVGEGAVDVRELRCAGCDDLLGGTVVSDVEHDHVDVEQRGGCCQHAAELAAAWDMDG